MAQTKQVALWSTGDAAKSYLASMQRRINCYVEKLPDGADEAQYITLDTPGLDEFFPNTPLDFGAKPVRGWIVVGEFLFVVVDKSLYRVTNAGTVTQINGSLTTLTGPVSMAANAKHPNNQIVIVDGVKLYVHTTGSTDFGALTGLAFNNPTTACFLDGFILVSFQGTGRWQIIGINDVSEGSISMLDYANAESKPDPLLNIQPLSGSAVMFGTRTLEFWQDSGAGNFPFARIPDSSVNVGLAARWSVAEFSSGDDRGNRGLDSLVMLATEKLGEYFVGMVVKGSVIRISTSYIESLINSMPTVVDAMAYSYVLGGHPFYVISFPTGNTTLLYDGSTGLWSELQDHRGDRHRSHMGILFQGRTLVSDRSRGYVYRLNAERYDDLHPTQGQTVKPMEIITRHERSHQLRSIAKLEILVEPSDTTVTGELMLAVSRDGGATFSQWLVDSMGAAGETLRRCVFRNIGAARDFVTRIRISSNVRRRIVGGWLTYR